MHYAGLQLVCTQNREVGMHPIDCAGSELDLHGLWTPVVVIWNDLGCLSWNVHGALQLHYPQWGAG